MNTPHKRLVVRLRMGVVAPSRAAGQKAAEGEVRQYND